VDTRLTEARRQEETATTNIAQMAQEAAKNSSTLADLQSELQSSRTELIAAQSRLSEATLAADTASQAANDATARLAELTQTKNTLEAQVAAYSEQIKTLQPQVEELTRTLAQRSAALQSLESHLTQAIAPSLERTAYQTSGGLKITLGEDGSFTLADRINRQVTGRYTISNDQMTLSDANGRLGTAQFPMTCPYAKTEEGFALGAADGCVLADQDFELVEKP
jgi:DNA repair exonuclease SbcCD ATPase subunit